MPLVSGIVATIGYLVTQHSIFAVVAAGAGVAAASAIVVVPALSVAAGLLAMRDKEQMRAIDMHAATSLLITLLGFFLGIVCVIFATAAMD